MIPPSVKSRSGYKNHTLVFTFCENVVCSSNKSLSSLLSLALSPIPSFLPHPFSFIFYFVPLPGRARLLALYFSQCMLPSGAGRPLPLAMETYQNVGSQCPQLHQNLPILPHPNLQNPILFQSGVSLLRVDALGGWEFNLHYNSASHWMRFCVWFPAISALRLQELLSPSGQTR